MSKTSLADRSKLILPDLDPIAIQTGLVVRQSRKFTPGAFLQTLLGSVVSGHASFNQLAAELGERLHAGMARQSLHQRLDVRSTAFLMSVLLDLMKQRFKSAATLCGNSPIRRILIEDASGQVMPKANAACFPAHGNHHGETAGVKIDLAYDLITGEVLSHSLHLATTQDKTIGKDLTGEISPGDLVLRDMGYFMLDEFTMIEGLGAWWLTRLPLTTGVELGNGVTLERRLKREKGTILDLRVVVGEQGKRCRLVAMRAAPEVAEARRAERRAKARRNGSEPSPTGLARDGWHLMLTNLDEEHAGVAQLAAIYRARWAVEIQFRAWKQSLNLTKALNRVSNEHHIHALVLAGMIAHQLGMKMAQVFGSRLGRARLSYERLYDLLAVYLVKASAFAALERFDPDPRYIKRDKRKRRSPIESGILALT